MSPEFPAKRLKYLVTLRKNRVEGKDSHLPYIGLEHIESGSGRMLRMDSAIDAPSSDTEREGDSLNNTFEVGDVLFGKLRPYLAKVWVSSFAGRSTTELLAMTPSAVGAQFLKYVCLSNAFVDAVNSSTLGSKMPRADWDFIGNMLVPSPATTIQRRISDFLDRDSAAFEALNSAANESLSLLAEKRCAVLEHSVTRGLDAQVERRDSGVPWLGLIPKHWTTSKLAWLFRERDERNEPQLPLLEVSINHGVILREFSAERIEDTASDFSTYKVARKLDIAFNKMRMWQGAVGVVPEDGLVSPDYVVAAPKGPLSSHYAGSLFRTAMFSGECERQSRGITWDRLRLYWDEFRDIVVPLPPLSEQRAIVDHIANEVLKLDRLRLATEATIKLLKERRGALIEAAVTGQLDVGVRG